VIIIILEQHFLIPFPKSLNKYIYQEQWSYAKEPKRRKTNIDRVKFSFNAFSDRIWLFDSLHRHHRLQLPDLESSMSHTLQKTTQMSFKSHCMKYNDIEIQI
jgi:hypothetical protein